MKNRPEIFYFLSSAILLWLGWPPIAATGPILWIALVPWLLGMEKIMRGSSLRKGSAIFGFSFLTAFIWNTASIYWVFNSLAAVMTTLPAIFISLIPFGLAALLMAFACWLYYQMRKKTNLMLSLLSLASFWIAYEYLHQTWDLAFPWMTLGNGFATTPELIQWYEYTGVYGGSVWIWAINALVFLLILSKKDGFSKRQSMILASLTLFIVCIPSVFSWFLYQGFTERVNPAEIVVVQPNIDPYHKFTTIPAVEQVDHLIQLSKTVAKPNTEFFIWPETSIPDAFGYDEATFREHVIFQRLQAFLDPYKNGNILSGIETFRAYSEPLTPTAREYQGVYYDHFNAVVLVENSAELSFYHKSKLVPGVEQLPFASTLAFLKPLFKAFGGTTGGYGKQDEASVLYAQSGIGAAPVICYESIWGNYVADYIRKGAQFIAIVTNDGWWGNTSGKDQHFHYARLRAIESRRWVARAANTGISGFINQRGEIIQRTDWWVEDARSQEINLNEDITFYVRFGDLIAYGMLVLAFFFVGFLIFKRFIPSNKFKTQS